MDNWLRLCHYPYTLPSLGYSVVSLVPRLVGGEEREPGIYCLRMRFIKVSNHVELCGCVPL